MAQGRARRATRMHLAAKHMHKAARIIKKAAKGRARGRKAGR